MQDISVLIGGKAGEGLNKAGQIIAHIFGALGYRIYLYYDYPSLIRGGHNFTIIRACEKPVSSHHDAIDVLLALNQETVTLHQKQLRAGGILLFDAAFVRAEGMGIPLSTILEEEKAPAITRNTGMIGAFCKAIGVRWEILEEVIRKDIMRETEKNIAVAHRGYEAVAGVMMVPDLQHERLPFVTGNEAVALGLLHGGLTTYIAYPMTPTSSILHFLAEVAPSLGLKVIHPENEIAVMLMAIGSAAAGERVAVGTSGGGFCLMTEGVSLAGMAEVPVVVVMGQRTGPSTGLPTYSGQTELFFVQHAGQGEFPRFIAAPGNAAEAYSWSAVALNIAWKYQTPAFILTDKNLNEGGFSLDLVTPPPPPAEWSPLSGEGSTYKRYALTESGISPFIPFAAPGAVVKYNGYCHDERGISTERPELVTMMQEKLMRKQQSLEKEISNIPSVNRLGVIDAATTLLCWGSCRGVCEEVAERRGLRVVQPVVLCPFPVEQVRRALEGSERVIAVEHNATGQLATLMQQYGFTIHYQIHKYDGRPFTIEELEERIKGVL